MNLFQLVLKQMRQRALGTWLTVLSVLLGVALATAVLLMRRGSAQLFGQTDFGYDLIIGPPRGSDLNLVLNTVYHLGRSDGNVPYDLYEKLASRGSEYGPLVRRAAPFMVGDSYAGHRIVGASPGMFGYDDAGGRIDNPWQYRRDKSFEFAQGRAFHPRRFEAVIGSAVADARNMHVYDPALTEAQNEARHAVFQATHGMPAAGEKADIHKPQWKIVGILKPTHTANDRVLFVPVVSLYAIEEHSYGLITQAMLKKGIDPTRLTPEQLRGALRELGFDPDDLPRSVLRKFSAAAPAAGPAGGPASGPATAPAQLSPTPWLQSKPATQPASAADGGAGDGGELLQSADADDLDHDHEEEAYHLDAEGNIVPDLPKDEWEVSAILVDSRGPFQAQTLMYRFRVANAEGAAVNPAATMREFFDTFLKNSSLVLLALAALVSVVAAISILVSIYNSVAARQREIAILRALGATRLKVLTLICLEAALVGLIGGILGLITGHLLGAAGSFFFQRSIGEGIDWIRVDPWEWIYLLVVIVVAFFAGLAPAMKAYRVPVATNLVAG